MKCPKCGAEMEIDTSIVFTSIPQLYIARCHNCDYQEYVEAETAVRHPKSENVKSPLFNYLKDNLKLDIRNDLLGNQHLCLILEDELINSIILSDD